jgi:hypothetical protein
MDGARASRGEENVEATGERIRVRVRVRVRVRG